MAQPDGQPERGITGSLLTSPWLTRSPRMQAGQPTETSTSCIRGNHSLGISPQATSNVCWAWGLTMCPVAPQNGIAGGRDVKCPMVRGDFVQRGQKGDSVQRGQKPVSTPLSTQPKILSGIVGQFVVILALVRIPLLPPTGSCLGRQNSRKNTRFSYEFAVRDAEASP